MRTNYSGCAICDSTWGNLWEEVEGERLFFCCSICSVQFRGLLQRIKAESGWSRIDSLEIEGDRRGRRCVARSGTEVFCARFACNSEGEILRFTRDSPPGTAPP